MTVTRSGKRLRSPSPTPEPRSSKRRKTADATKEETMQLIMPAAEGESVEIGHQHATLADLTEVAQGSWFLQSTAVPGSANKRSRQKSKSKALVPMVTQTIRVQLPQSFLPQQVFITDGVFKDCHAIILKPVLEKKPTTVGLLDLPPEVRNQIWDFHFDGPATITIGSWKSPPPKRQRYSRVTEVFDATTRFQSRRKLERMRLAAQWLRKSVVVAVCRQINEETAPVWYGSNKFFFQQMSELETFMKSVGSMKKFIRFIEFGRACGNNCKLARRLSLLRDMNCLSRLTFHHELLHWDGRVWNRPGCPVDNVAIGLLPVLKHLQQAKQSTKTDKSLLDIVEVEGISPCWRQECIPSQTTMNLAKSGPSLKPAQSLTEFEHCDPCREQELLQFLMKGLRANQ